MKPTSPNPFPEDSDSVSFKRKEKNLRGVKEIKNHPPIVSGSSNPNFLLDAVNELYTYRTPKKIIDYMQGENIKAIIGNPPFL